MNRPLATVLALLLLAAPAAASAQVSSDASPLLAQGRKKARSSAKAKKKKAPSRKRARAAAQAPASEAPAAEAQAPAAASPLEAEAAAPASPLEAEAAPASLALGAEDSPALPAAPGGQEAGLDSLDFDLLEPAPAADVAQAVDPALEAAIGRRRTMLKLHQGLGIAMATGLVASTVLGQLQFNDSFRGGGDTRRLLPWHRGTVIATSALFATVGTLGLLAPTPYEKQGGWDTVRMHKIFMTLATVGMVTQMALGIMATQRYGQLSEVSFATAHQVVGYATLGAVSAGMLMLVF